MTTLVVVTDPPQKKEFLRLSRARFISQGCRKNTPKKKRIYPIYAGIYVGAGYYLDLFWREVFDRPLPPLPRLLLVVCSSDKCCGARISVDRVAVSVVGAVVARCLGWGGGRVSGAGVSARGWPVPGCPVRQLEGPQAACCVEGGVLIDEALGDARRAPRARWRGGGKRKPALSIPGSRCHAAKVGAGERKGGRGLPVTRPSRPGSIRGKGSRRGRTRTGDDGSSAI